MCFGSISKVQQKLQNLKIKYKRTQINIYFNKTFKKYFEWLQPMNQNFVVTQEDIYLVYVFFDFAEP